MNNPIIQREFFGILRTPRALATLLALTVAFSVGVMMRWPADETVDLSGTQAREVFRVFGYGLVAGIVFLVPAFPATSIVNEKNDGTLALLLNSPLSAFSIYAGKISGVLLFSVLILACSLPASAACYAMGGINLQTELGLLYLVLALMILQYSTLGMLVSSYVQTADAGVRITYTAVLALFFLTLVPALMVQGTESPDYSVAFAKGLRALSPLPTVMEIMDQEHVASDSLDSSATATWYIVVSLLTSAVFAIWTLARLNHRIFDYSRSQGLMTHDRGTLVKIARRLFFIVDPQRRKRGIPWYFNPVMVKEFRCRRFGRSQWLLRLVSICAIASMVLTFMSATSMTAWGVDRVGGMLVLLQVILVVILTPSLASGLISGERDSGGWDLLRATPMSASKVVRGKLLSVLWTMLLVLMATLPGYVMLIWLMPKMSTQVSMVLICLAWTVVYALAVSAAVGSLFRSTSVSTAVTYVAVLALFAIPVLIWLGRDAPFGRPTVETALLLNPVGAALSQMEAPGFESYNLLPAAWWVAGAISLFMFFVFGAKVWQLSRAT